METKKIERHQVYWLYFAGGVYKGEILDKESDGHNVRLGNGSEAWVRDKFIFETHDEAIECQIENNHI